MTKVEQCSDEEDIYSDLPNFQYEDEVKKLEEMNKTLIQDKQKLQERIDDLQKQLDKIQKEKSEIQKKNNGLSYNISSLYKTAQSEIQRKDRLIQELRKTQNDTIFRRRNSERRNRRDFSEERQYEEKSDTNERKDYTSRNNDSHTHSAIETNLEENGAINIMVEKVNNINPEDNKPKIKDSDKNNSQFIEKHTAEVETPITNLSSLNLNSDDVKNHQKTKDAEINTENHTKLENNDVTEINHEKKITENEESTSKTQMKSKGVPPRLNVPLTAYTRRMYKKHYGVSPEKNIQNEFSSHKEKKEVFQAEENAEIKCSNSVSENVIANASKSDCTPDTRKMGKDVQEQNSVCKDENKLFTLTQNSEENVKNNSVRKPVRRISRVGKQILEKNVSSDFIKLGDRSISKKIVEQRMVTDKNKKTKISQLIAPYPAKVTRSFTKKETSSATLTVMISNKNEEENTSSFKVTTNDTIESVINRAKSNSPKEKEDRGKKTSIVSSKLQSIERLSKHRKNTTVINPVTTYNVNNKDKQSITESLSDKADIVKHNVIKEDKNIASEIKIERPKIIACKKSRQAKFLDSLFGSPTKPETIQKSKDESVCKSVEQNSEIKNDKVISENKMIDNTSAKQMPNKCVSNDEKLVLKNQNKTPNIIISEKDKVSNPAANKLSNILNSEVLTKFQFQMPVTKTEYKNSPTTQLDLESNCKNVDNNPHSLTMDQNSLSTFKKSPTQNSMYGFTKSADNTCFSANEDTIGMVSALARVRTQISPIKTPDKKAVSVESGDENASSPTVMTRARLRESESLNDDNKKENKNYFSSVSTFTPLSQSPKSTPGLTTSEHCEFRRSKRVLALVKKSATSNIKTVSLSPSKSPGFKRKLNMSDSSSSSVAQIKRQKVDESVKKNEEIVDVVKVLPGSSKEHNVIQQMEEKKITTQKHKISKQTEDKEICSHDKEKISEHFERKSNDKIGSSHRKSSDRRRLPNERKLEKNDQRIYKTRSHRSPSPKKCEYETSRHKRKKRRFDNRIDKQRNKSVSSDESDYDECKRKSSGHRKTLHKIFSSRNRAGFQRHSPSEFFNRKQKNSRRFLSNRFRRFGSPSLRHHRNSSPYTGKYLLTRKRERNEERNAKRRKDREHNEDLRKDINKESLKNVQVSTKCEKEKEQTQYQRNQTSHENNWKLTLISIEESRKSKLTPSPSIEKGRYDPRMTANQTISETDCSQKIKFNRILTDQTNQSNQVSPDIKKPISTSSTPEKKTLLIISRRSRRNITFEDTTSDNNTNNKIQNLKEHTNNNKTASQTNTAVNDSDNLITEQKKLHTTTKEKNVPDQNICALTTENVQKLNETLPSRCLDNSSIHTSNFPKKIVKTPLDFRQKYASVFTNSSDSSVDELDAFGSVTGSDESRASDRTWKP